MAKRGKFIVFEGTDGSGKSTQMKRLGHYLTERGVECFFTNEPSQGPVGALLRACLTGRIEADEYTVAAMFAADRLDHINNPVDGIRKKLEEGVCVLCDRYYLSSFAYNGGFVPLDWVISLNASAMEQLRPDLTVFLDLPAEEGMERVLHRGSAERYETLEKQTRIRENYFSLFKRFPEENVRIVRSEKDKELTQKNLRAIADQLFGWQA
ncbi:MAG: dTMP kinase [Candidatus Gallimonas sp.]